jgi:hypothetical protein
MLEVILWDKEEGNRDIFSVGVLVAFVISSLCLLFWYLLKY